MYVSHVIASQRYFDEHSEKRDAFFGGEMAGEIFIFRVFQPFYSETRENRRVIRTKNIKILHCFSLRAKK